MTNNRQNNISSLKAKKSDWDLNYRNLKAESPQEIDRAQEALWEIREKWKQLDKNDEQAEKIKQWIDQSQGYLNQFRAQANLTKMVHYGQIFLYFVLPLSTLVGLSWILFMLIFWDLTSLFPSVMISTYGLATAATIGFVFYVFFILPIQAYQYENSEPSSLHQKKSSPFFIVILFFFTFFGFYVLLYKSALYVLILTIISLILYIPMYRYIKVYCEYKKIKFNLILIPFTLFVIFCIIFFIGSDTSSISPLEKSKNRQDDIPIFVLLLIFVCVITIVKGVLESIPCKKLSVSKMLNRFKITELDEKKINRINTSIFVFIIIVCMVELCYCLKMDTSLNCILNTRTSIHNVLQRPLLLTGLTQRPDNSQWYLISEHFYKDNQISSQSIQWKKESSDKENQAHLQTNSVYGYLLWNGSPSKVLCPEWVNIDDKINERCLIINEKYLQPMPSHLIKADNTNQKE